LAGLEPILSHNFERHSGNGVRMVSERKIDIYLKKWRSEKEEN
jgi:hypothetical protein